jgi:hypothetical protein
VDGELVASALRRRQTVSHERESLNSHPLVSSFVSVEVLMASGSTLKGPQLTVSLVTDGVRDCLYLLPTFARSPAHLGA